MTRDLCSTSILGGVNAPNVFVLNVLAQPCLSVCSCPGHLPSPEGHMGKLRPARH